MFLIDRFILVIAALIGAVGVGLAAYAAHVPGGGNVATAANMLLFHAPALGLVALASALNAGRRWLARAAALVMMAGLALFCGALALPILAQIRLPLPNAAPIGGTALITGWLIFAIAALMKGRK